MMRIIPGLNQAGSLNPEQLEDGIFLVRVVRAHYRWHLQKPYYLIRFAVVEPQPEAKLLCRFAISAH